MVVLRPNEPIPESVRVLLGGPPEDARSVRLHKDSEVTMLAVLVALFHPLPFKRATFGVDPGQISGLALLGDGQPLMWAECLSAAAIVERIVAWRQAVSAESWHLHVGDGTPESMGLLSAVKKIWPEISASLVHEQATTPISPQTMSRHTDAALIIAHRNP